MCAVCECVCVYVCSEKGKWQSFVRRIFIRTKMSSGLVRIFLVGSAMKNSVHIFSFRARLPGWWRAAHYIYIYLNVNWESYYFFCASSGTSWEVASQIIVTRSQRQVTLLRTLQSNRPKIIIKFIYSATSHELILNVVLAVAATAAAVTAAKGGWGVWKVHTIFASFSRHMIFV